MVKFVQKAIKEIHQELYPKFKYHFAKDDNVEIYASGFVMPRGENLNYFNGEEVFENNFKKYNGKYKLWALMGSSNTTYTDKKTGEKSYYPIYYFRLLVERMKKSGLKNDVLITCTTSNGGYDHRSYPKKIRQRWTGKFL